MIEGLLRPGHLLLIFVVAVFVFGPKKLPELGKGLAQGIRSFKDGFKLTEQSAAQESDGRKN
jgi:sec-independent protein translocase protein TatA